MEIRRRECVDRWCGENERTVIGMKRKVGKLSASFGALFIYIFPKEKKWGDGWRERDTMVNVVPSSKLLPGVWLRCCSPQPQHSQFARIPKNLRKRKEGEREDHKLHSKLHRMDSTKCIWGAMNQTNGRRVLFKSFLIHCLRGHRDRKVSTYLICAD